MLSNRAINFIRKNPHLKDDTIKFILSEIDRENKLIKINERRLEKYNKKLKEMKKELFLLEFQSKVYEQRTFPTVLRNYIFNRDNFTCKVCNTHKDNLPDKINLEVDHIIEWEDGGETTLDNGQTICSDCNKGKHHSKKYLKLVV